MITEPPALRRTAVTATCRAQGVPELVTDQATLAKVARTMRRGSDFPDRLEPARLKLIEAADRRGELRTCLKPAAWRRAD